MWADIHRDCECVTLTALYASLESCCTDACHVCLTAVYTLWRLAVTYTSFPLEGRLCAYGNPKHYAAIICTAPKHR